jgi:glutathione S-transferase
MKFPVAVIASFVSSAQSFTAFSSPTTKNLISLQMSTTMNTAIVPSWSEIQSTVGETSVGQALNNEVELRSQGKGSAHVHNKLRLFQSKDDKPVITFYRDHAGWCPYCQKTMLLLEEKQVPINIELVPMRSYGDKPESFLRKVPSGLLPAIEVNGQIITESSVIMELLDKWHPIEDGYKPMMPQEEAGMQRYEQLSRLERELFSWWCTLIFRPELPGFGGDNPLSKLMGGGGDTMSGSMKGFMDCIQKVDKELQKTNGPWFFDNEYPTMIDFVFVSHVERMLASCAHWKGLNLRDPKWKLNGLNAWLDAFEKREHYLAFKSDYYTHIKDIPPQYGPGNDGGFEKDREAFSSSVLGKGDYWRLPLSHDDPLQPLYRGPPLPISILKSAEIVADADGSYQSADPVAMAKACRLMAAWKLAGNGGKVAKFAARGGPEGAKNPRKTFGAELADPYAAADASIAATVDEALRVVCLALKETDQEMPGHEFMQMLQDAVPSNQVEGVISSMRYVRDRVGVPRDLPLASARYFRAYLNWGIDTLMVV